MKNYPGHKNRDGVYHKIINQIPKCDVFRELFAGSAAISARLSMPEGQLHLNEKNPKVFQDLRFNFPQTIVTNDCAISVIENLPRQSARKEVIYLDPPYRHATRPQNTLIYEFEMIDADHEQLLVAVLEKESHYDFIIQHPTDELYDSMLSHWRKVEVKIRYHKKTSVEFLYMNFDAPMALQDYAYLGSDRHERQRIKRKGDRLVKKLGELPDLERQYVLDRLRELHC